MTKDTPNESATPKTDLVSFERQFSDDGTGKPNWPRLVAYVDDLEHKIRLISEQHATTIDVLEQTRRELVEAKRELEKMTEKYENSTVSECFAAQLKAEQRLVEAKNWEKDAERYRWLRNNKNTYPLFFIAQRSPENIVVQFTDNLADLNIDAAIAQEKI